MGKHQKTLQQLQKSPTPSDIRWDDVVALLKSHGYVLINKGGSRRRFHNPTTNDLILCHEPHPEKTIPKGLVREIAEHLKSKGII